MKTYLYSHSNRISTKMPNRTHWSKSLTKSTVLRLQ